MRTPNDLLASGLPTDTRSSSTTTETSMAKPSASLVDQLWRRMLGMYGHTWASQYGDHATGVTAETWASALVGLTPPQIADGLRACVAEGDEFPPNAPRFRAMCLGIPSFASVKRETLLPDAERSPFTRAVWIRVDGYAHRQASTKDADRMLRETYDQVRDEVMRGNPIPQVAALLTHETNPKPIGIPETREARAQRLSEILGNDYNPDTNNPDYDPKWRIREMRDLYNPPAMDEE